MDEGRGYSVGEHFVDAARRRHEMSERASGATAQDDIVEDAKVLRSALQASGASDATPWDELNPYRQDRHCQTVIALRESGYRIVAADAVLLTAADREAIGRVGAFLDELVVSDPYCEDAYGVMNGRLRNLINPESMHRLPDSIRFTPEDRDVLRRLAAREGGCE